MHIEILALEESLKYLGKQISFHTPVETELQNRIRAGWAKFMCNKQEL